MRNEVIKLIHPHHVLKLKQPFFFKTMDRSEITSIFTHYLCFFHVLARIGSNFYYSIQNYFSLMLLFHSQDVTYCWEMRVTHCCYMKCCIWYTHTLKFCTMCFDKRIIQAKVISIFGLHRGQMLYSLTPPST